MTSTIDLFHSHWAQAFAWTLVHSLWEFTAIAGLTALVLVSLRGKPAALRYWVAYFALASMGVVAWITFQYGLDRLQVHGSPAYRVSAAGNPPGWAMATPWVVGLWLCGALWRSAQLVLGLRWVSRLTRTGVTQAGPTWMRRVHLRAQALGIRRRVRMLISTKVNTAMTVGWLRPVILIPASALTGMPVHHLETIIIHELAHVARHDYLLNLLQSVLEIAFFYHPAMRWVAQQIRAEREHCCDDIATAYSGDALNYIRALTELETIRCSARQSWRLSMSATQGNLMSRVQRIIDPTASPGVASWLAPLLICTGLAIGVATIACDTEDADYAQADIERSNAIFEDDDDRDDDDDDDDAEERDQKRAAHLYYKERRQSLESAFNLDAARERGRRLANRVKELQSRPGYDANVMELELKAIYAEHAEKTEVLTKKALAEVEADENLTAAGREELRAVIHDRAKVINKLTKAQFEDEIVE